VFLEAGRIGAQAKIIFCTNRHDSKLVYDDEKWLSCDESPFSRIGHFLRSRTSSFSL